MLSILNGMKYGQKSVFSFAKKYVVRLRAPWWFVLWCKFGA
jgi:hypothetical protein